GSSGAAGKTWNTAGAVNLSGGGTLALGGTTASLAGLTLAAGTTLDVVGPYSLAQLQPLRVGTRLEIGPGGVLDSTGATLTLGAGTGPLTLAGGTLKGGTVNASGGAKVIVTAPGGTLDGVTLDGDLDLTAAGAFLGVADGLTLNGIVSLGDPGNASA